MILPMNFRMLVVLSGLAVGCGGAAHQAGGPIQTIISREEASLGDRTLLHNIAK